MQAGDLSQLCPGLTPTGILQMHLSFFLVSSPSLCYLFFTKVPESHRFAQRSSHEPNSTLSSLNRLILSLGLFISGHSKHWHWQEHHAAAVPGASSVQNREIEPSVSRPPACNTRASSGSYCLHPCHS